MSLEGSLETIALPEVLHLLSDTSKSGELLVSGDRGDGRLWFDAGRLNGFEVQRCADAADALFELLRAGRGRFSFQAGNARTDTAHAVGEDGGEDVRPILEVAQAHLEEWSGIVAVVPSLDHKISLAPEAPREKIQLSSAQWSLVVTIGEGRSVGEVLDVAGLSEFEGCRCLKTLVETKLALVSEPEVAEEADFGFEVEPDEEPESLDVVEAEPAATLHALSMLAEEAVAESAPEMLDTEESSAVVVNGGEFDGHDFVFKSPAQPFADGYEPQPVPYPEVQSNGHGDPGVFDVETHEDSGDDSMTSRAALEALLAEIPADEEAGTDMGDVVNGDVHDGLADRGPWTSKELASFDQMGGWQDDAGESDPEQAAHDYDFSHVEEADQQTASADDFQFEPASEASGGPVAEAEELEESDEEETEEPEPEPVNRGLLLKFLSSVRS